MLFGDGLDAARAELHLVTPREQAVERRLQVRSAPAAREKLPVAVPSHRNLVGNAATQALKQLAKQ